MPIAVPRCATKRLVSVVCRLCGDGLELEVEGLPSDADVQEWVDSFTAKRWQDIHDGHSGEAETVIERARTDTRRL